MQDLCSSGIKRMWGRRVVFARIPAVCSLQSFILHFNYDFPFGALGFLELRGPFWIGLWWKISALFALRFVCLFSFRQGVKGQQRGRFFAFPWVFWRGEGAASSLGRERGSAGAADAGRGTALLICAGGWKRVFFLKNHSSWEEAASNVQGWRKEPALQGCKCVWDVYF